MINYKKYKVSYKDGTSVEGYLRNESGLRDTKEFSIIEVDVQGMDIDGMVNCLKVISEIINSTGVTNYIIIPKKTDSEPIRITEVKVDQCAHPEDDWDHYGCGDCGEYADKNGCRGPKGNVV